MVEIIEATTEESIGAAKALFQEYAASLDFNLCFQNFDQELADFPKQYAAPEGGLFLARSEGTPVGCVAFRFFEEGVCEMKRLYVQPDSRGHHTGLKLAEAAIAAAKARGYQCMRLDTLDTMKRANQLYRSLGFKEIAPYRHNPIEGAIYMELDLERA